jgi:hypothetical protein
MWRSKKFIIVMVLAAVVAAGSIGGIALAQEDEEESPTTKLGEFMERVCAIYEDNTGVAIDQEALREAIAQARREVRDEALNNYLQNLVDQGKITQEQADEYLEWWQARPDVPIAAGLGGRGMLRGFGGPGGFEPPE